MNNHKMHTHYSTHHHHALYRLITSIILPLLFFLSSAGAQSGPGDSGSPDITDPYSFSPAVGITLVIFVTAFFFTVFLCFYLRYCADPDSNPQPIAAAAAAATGRPSRGLDSSVIDSFPTFAYSSVKSLRFGKGALECAVCLNEFEDDDTLRLIPKCDHVFHPDCIDAWLSAHTTCPVCRADLAPQTLAGSTRISPDDQEQSNAAIVVDEVIPGQDLQQAEDGGEDNREICEEPADRVLEVADIASQRLSRNRTRKGNMNNFPGRTGPGWLGRFTRSNTTGHVEVKQWENVDRFTLRVPDEVRKQIMSGKLTRSTSCLVLPTTEGSTRRGVRRPAGRGSSRFEQNSRSDRRGFSLALNLQAFFSRWPSLSSPRVAAGRSGSPRSNNISFHSTKGNSGFGSDGEPVVHPPV